MGMDKYVCVWLCCFICCLGCGRNPEPYKMENVDFARLLDSSQANGKPIIVVQTSGECDVCHAMAKEWRKNGVTDFLAENGLCIVADISLPENSFLPWLLNTIVTPVILVISEEGKVSYAHHGYIRGKALKNVLERIQRKEVVLPEWEEGFYTASGIRFYQVLEGCLKAFLRLDSRDSLVWREELGNVARSVETEPYFMNCYLGWKLSSLLEEQEEAKKYKDKALSCLQPKERLIYADLLKEFLPEKNGETLPTVPPVFDNCYDFGEDESEAPEFVIPFTNKSMKTLIIKSVESSCDCMGIEWERKPLLVGQNGEIRIRYKKNGKMRIMKKVYIYTNLAKRPYEVEIRCDLL